MLNVDNTLMLISIYLNSQAYIGQENVPKVFPIWTCLQELLCFPIGAHAKLAATQNPSDFLVSCVSVLGTVVWETWFKCFQSRLCGLVVCHLGLCFHTRTITHICIGYMLEKARSMGEYVLCHLLCTHIPTSWPGVSYLMKLFFTLSAMSLPSLCFSNQALNHRKTTKSWQGMQNVCKTNAIHCNYGLKFGNEHLA